jgi:CO dehydrogenase/acetyl-CoA synthase gamma subunit (corrinoid Fe-S protein)
MNKSIAELLEGLSQIADEMEISDAVLDKHTRPVVSAMKEVMADYLQKHKKDIEERHSFNILVMNVMVNLVGQMMDSLIKPEMRKDAIEVFGIYLTKWFEESQKMDEKKSDGTHTKKDDKKTTKKTYEILE